MSTKIAAVFAIIFATVSLMVSAAPQPALGAVLGGILGAPHHHHDGSTAHTSSNNGNIENSCNTGSVQCCNETFTAGSSRGTLLRSLLGIDIGDVTALVGVQCSPISAIVGIGSGASCSSQPVCCSGNTFSGLVSIGCSPVNVNL